MSGFIDLQVNGYGGVDFNADSLSEESMVGVCQRLRQDGTDKILATIITAPFDAMLARIGRLSQLIQSNVEIASVVAGIHVEGPFLNSTAGFVGAHPAEATMDASIDVARRLLDAGEGNVKQSTAQAARCQDRFGRKVTKRCVVLVKCVHRYTIGRCFKGFGDGGAPATVRAIRNANPVDSAEHDRLLFAEDDNSLGPQRHGDRPTLGPRNAAFASRRRPWHPRRGRDSC